MTGPETTILLPPSLMERGLTLRFAGSSSSLRENMTVLVCKLRRSLATLLAAC